MDWRLPAGSHLRRRLPRDPGWPAMTRAEFLEYQFEAYGQAKELWGLFFDIEAEWKRYREIQENNARYLAAADRVKASRPGLSEEELDRIIRREHREVRFDLPAADRRGRYTLFHLRRLIEEKMEKARAAGDTAAVTTWQKATAAFQRLVPEGKRVPLPPI